MWCEGASARGNAGGRQESRVTHVALIRLWLPAAEALKTNTSCKRLTIYGCDIGPEGAAALADALLQNTALQSIDYNENKMTWAGLKKIEAAWEQTRSDSGQHAIATGAPASKRAVSRKRRFD